MLLENLPVLILLVIHAGIFGAQNKGWFTSDQAMALMATLGTLGAAVTHRLEKPRGKRDAS